MENKNEQILNKIKEGKFKKYNHTSPPYTFNEEELRAKEVFWDCVQKNIPFSFNWSPAYMDSQKNSTWGVSKDANSSNISDIPDNKV